MWWDEPARAIATFEELLDHQRFGGDESVEPYLLVLLGQASCLRGDFDAAARSAAEGLELAEQTGQGSMAAYLLALRGFVAANTDGAASPDAERAVELGLRTAGRPAELLFVAVALGTVITLATAFVLVSGGNLDPARVTFEDLVEAGGAPRMDIFVVTPGATMRLDCVRIGDEASDTPASGKGLSYCKWHRALNSDLREYQATYGAAPVG